MPRNASRGGGFWSTLPGVLTGVAAVLTAGTAAIVTIRQVNAPHGVNAPASELSPYSRATGAMGPLEPGISYNQGDLYDRPASSAEECARLCYNDDRCRAMTFIISQQRCWIKNQVNPAAASSDMVSARKQS